MAFSTTAATSVPIMLTIGFFSKAEAKNNIQLKLQEET